MSISFLFLEEYICCGYSLEAPHGGASNEYPQNMFSSRNKKTVNFQISFIGWTNGFCTILVHYLPELKKAVALPPMSRIKT